MMLLAKLSHNSSALIVLTCIHVAAGALSTGRVWKTNCFGETDSGRCEDSWIKISSTYYLCDLVIAAEAPPKRIEYVNGNILAAIGSQTFVVFNDTLNPMNARILIPPRSEFVDKKDNRYYAADGTTYMAVGETKKEIEILTTGEYSVNQLAFDNKSNQLLILSFSAQSEKNERAGSLFAINTEIINLANDSVQAEKVDGAGNRITAMAVDGDIEKLLLGMRTPQGGKLIRLTKQKGNPCIESAFDKATIVSIVNETQEKLLKYFENVATKPINADVQLRKNEDLSTRALELENIKLKRNLLVATTKLNSFNSKLTAYNRHLKSVQTGSAAGYSASIGQAAGYGASASGGAGYGGGSFASSVRSGGYGGSTFGYTQGDTDYVGSPFSNTEGSAGYRGSPYGNLGGVVGYGSNAFGNVRGSIGYMGSPFGGLRDGAYFRGGVPGGTWRGASHSGFALDGTWRDAGYANSPFGDTRGCVGCGGNIPRGTWGGPPYRPWVREVYGNNAFGSPVGIGGYNDGGYGGSQGTTGYGDSPCDYTEGCAGYSNSPYIGSVENGGNTFRGSQNVAGYGSPYSSSYSSPYNRPYSSPMRSGSHGSNAFSGIQGGTGSVGSQCGHTGRCTGYGSSATGGTQEGAVTGGGIAGSTEGGLDDIIIGDAGSGSGHDDSVVGSIGEGAGFGSSTAGITEESVGLDDGEKINVSSVLGNIEESADYGDSPEETTQGDHDLDNGLKEGVGDDSATTVTNISERIERPKTTKRKKISSNAESEAGAGPLFPSCVPIDVFNKLSLKTEEAEITNQKLMRELEALSLNVEGLFNDTVLSIA